MIRALFIAALFAGPAMAGEFSEGSNAKEWGLRGEETATFRAKVVDVLCELSGDCPADCGGGARQMGLLREADGALILAIKNAQAAFTGAATDLQLYCGQTVDVDGVLVGDVEEGEAPTKFYMVQTITPEDGETAKANQWTKLWAKANPEAAAKKGSWFRKDPRILSEIEAHGYLGLGAEEDRKFIEYYFE